MTKYRLKDQELQAKLDELSGGEFSKDLHLFDDEHFASGWGKNICFTQTEDENGEELEEPRTDKTPQFAVFFNANEVEAVPEYNPHSWNVWPDVEPPENVWMRLEVFRSNSREQHTYRYYAKFLKNEWKNGEGGKVDIIEDDDVRFRPWE